MDSDEKYDKKIYINKKNHGKIRKFVLVNAYTSEFSPSSHYEENPMNKASILKMIVFIAPGS